MSFGSAIQSESKEALQRSCCAFMLFERSYRSTVPADFAKVEFEGIKKAFHGNLKRGVHG